MMTGWREMEHWSLHQELIKAALSCISGLVVLALGWLVGLKFSYQWNIR